MKECVDLVGFFCLKLPQNSPFELGAKFYFHSLETLEELNTPEGHSDVVLGVESVDILWALEVNLQPDEVPVEVNDVPGKVFH